VRPDQKGIVVKPEVMIPLTGHVNDSRSARPRLEAVAEQVMEEQGVQIEYKFGTMIEVPRGALTAGQIAEYAQFFSFGHNDLTQTTFGYSRDDAEGKFLLRYVEDKVLPENPFQVLDRDGVGQLVKMAVTEGRKTRPISRSASAASTVAIRRPSSSAFDRAELCFLQPVPRAGGSPGGGASRARTITRDK